MEVLKLEAFYVRALAEVEADMEEYFVVTAAFPLAALPKKPSMEEGPTTTYYFTKPNTPPTPNPPPSPHNHQMGDVDDDDYRHEDIVSPSSDPEYLFY